MLKEHNIPVYNDLCSMLDAHGKAMVIACTGHGKSYIVQEYLEQNHIQNAMVVVNSRAVKDIWNNMSDKIHTVTYQAFSKMPDEEYQLVVFDEAHHTGSKVWGKRCSDYMNTHPDTLFIGLTADAKRWSDGGRDMSEELFNGHVVYGKSLNDAIDEGILPPFTYISAIFGIEQSIENVKKRASARHIASLDHLISRLQYTAENIGDISSIIQKHIPHNKRKGIVFVDSIDNIEEGVNLILQNFQVPCFPYHSGLSEKQNLESIAMFSELEEGWIVTVNKLNEGVHIDGVNTIIMLRRTQSPAIFFQQLGRTMSTNNFGSDIVIFDFVGNNVTLREHAASQSQILALSKRKNNKGNNQVILQDYATPALELLAKIEELLQRQWTKEEDDILIDCYKQGGTLLDAEKALPDRSRNSISHRARFLKLTQQGWTEEELKILKKYYPSVGTKIAKLLSGHTIEAIGTKARELGLKYNGVHRWSEEDDTIIREFFPTEGKSVAKRFFDGRTEGQCKDRAQRLGVKGPTKAKTWTEEEDAFLRKHYPTEGCKCFSGLPARSQRSCYARAFELGIKCAGDKYKTTWTKEEEEILRKEYPILGSKCFEKFPQYSTSACYGKVHRMGLSCS